MAANFLIFGNGYHPRWPTGKGKDKGKASPKLGGVHFCSKSLSLIVEF